MSRGRCRLAPRQVLRSHQFGPRRAPGRRHGHSRPAATRPHPCPRRPVRSQRVRPRPAWPRRHTRPAPPPLARKGSQAWRQTIMGTHCQEPSARKPSTGNQTPACRAKQPMIILPSEITPPQSYFDRRRFIDAAGALALGGLLPASGLGPAAGGTQECALRAGAADAARRHRQLRQLPRIRVGQERPCRTLPAHGRAALDRQCRGPGGEAAPLRHRRPAEAAAGGAHLPPPLRRGLVDGGAVGRLSAGRAAEAGRAAGQRQVRRVRVPRRPGDHAQRAPPTARLALPRRTAPGRSAAPADHPRRRPLRRSAAQAQRRAAAPGGAVEIRLQERKVDRGDTPGRTRTATPSG